MQTSFVSNVVTTYPFDAFMPGITSAFNGGPFQMTRSKTVRNDNTLQPNLLQNFIHDGHASASNLDPGPWKLRYPKTWKGTIVGTDPHFPTGLNMLDETILNVKGISSTTVRPNNLRVGPIAVSAGATTLTVPFPTQSYSNFTTLTASAANIAGGSLPAGTYFYAVSSRTASSGPAAVPLSTSVTVAAPNNAVTLTMGSFLGTDTYIEGVTVYRGTASGIYTVRYDVFPVSSVWTIATDGTGKGTLTDYSSTNLINGFGPGSGFPDWGISATPTTNYTGTTAWDGAKWIPSVNQTGWEPDPNYDVQVETSWATSVGVTGHLPSGPSLVFGTACPGGGGTVTLKIGR
jgi:hypothetical protein